MGSRFQQLSQPKLNHLRYLNRRSVYWLDKLPQEKTESTTQIELTSRWSDLTSRKIFNTQIPLSPIWEVSKWALRAVPSERLCKLAQPRPPAPGWQPGRPLPTPVSRGTQSAVASSRLRELAQPRRQQLQVLSSCRSEPRPTTQLASRTSAHIEVLATPKHNHPEYKGERPVCWPVSKAARHHVASQRLCELSYPKRRKALFEGYNPYVVSRAARSANPSTRIQELCLPLPRKYSSKEW
ncbi:theg spermatid protein [Cyprinodon tularosa]|uniref:testicular haploid expressed gene protein n=1 Tax=Cyprinodon variegatus TaxID=28743 RepID=UPI0007429E53|nr:PREDICTED: testicular haploid expressed gene protein [Cyprinodon variegatus]XP_038129750.1 theg spermatid protein [Cyprinodon tularosa]